jgi:hypothetical protein
VLPIACGEVPGADFGVVEQLGEVVDVTAVVGEVVDVTAVEIVKFSRRNFAKTVVQSPLSPGTRRRIEYLCNTSS